MDEMKQTCGCVHHKFVPVLIILFALVFLLKALDMLEEKVVSIAWPVILGVGGFLKLTGKGCKCC